MILGDIIALIKVYSQKWFLDHNNTQFHDKQPPFTCLYYPLTKSMQLKKSEEENKEVFCELFPFATQHIQLTNCVTKISQKPIIGLNIQVFPHQKK